MADMAPRDGETIVSEPGSERALVWVGSGARRGCRVAAETHLHMGGRPGVGAVSGPFKFVASIGEP